jgi:hypothetical protein
MKNTLLMAASAASIAAMVMMAASGPAEARWGWGRRLAWRRVGLARWLGLGRSGVRRGTGARAYSALLRIRLSLSARILWWLLWPLLRPALLPTSLLLLPMTPRGTGSYRKHNRTVRARLIKNTMTYFDRLRKAATIHGLH